MNFPLWVLAALIAVLSSLMLRAVGNEKALRWKAWLPFSYVILFDAIASTALLALNAVVQQFRHGELGEMAGLAPTLLPTVLCGIAAPAVLRTQTPASWRGFLGGRRLMGPVRKLQQQAERDVEDICTAEETIWLREEIVQVACLSVEDLGDWAERYMKRRSLPELSRPRARQASIKQIRDIVADTDSRDEVRRMTIVQVLLDNVGHRAVRQLFKYGRAKAPGAIVRHRGRTHRFLCATVFAARDELSMLRRDIRLPTGYQSELLDNRLRICRPDRVIDDAVRELARVMGGELGGRGSVEGIYQGWIVIRPSIGRRAGATVLRNARCFAQLLRDCDSLGKLVVQPNGVVLDDVSGLFATAGLLASPMNSPRTSSPYCGDAFAGQGAWLAIDIGFDSDCAYKRHFYGGAGVPLYLLVDIAKGQLTIHSELHEGAYRCVDEVEFGAKLSLPHPLEVIVDTSELRKPRFGGLLHRR
ncbi:hypothetical protein [Nocardia sp. NPDC057668]|uniref:hypothetical protein n=1 Tax=Nocardia sp. NPDC057668 TaxID=3346202 RepID=UPI00366B0927